MWCPVLLTKTIFGCPKVRQKKIVSIGHKIQPSHRSHQESAIVIAGDDIYLITGRISTSRQDEFRRTISNEIFLRTDCLETAKKGYFLSEEFLLDWTERYFASNGQTGIVELVKKLDSTAKIEVPEHRIFVAAADAGFEDSSKNYMTLEEYTQRNR